ncbi:hypothetical protein [Aeromonas phage ZPAH34]|uniref:hypothetical protein n=1 Tax=Aeromonas phage ZPAH34 TaxID=2924888 RepID=UPI002329378F|nr:hypothetical protein PQD16_gp214 [Aeromonas phage ZPAH34]UOX39469.1 hypothetical protein [Aeromonas phage ZPAH34]
MNNNRLFNFSKRTFLRSGSDLSAMSFTLSLSRYTRLKNPEQRFLYLTGKISIFLRDHIIIIHENDLTTPDISIQDFEKKLNVISKSIGEAISSLDKEGKQRDRFILKRFLNESDGVSDLYTSTIAITITETHGITFEIASCDHKTRIILHGKKAALNFFNKFKETIDSYIEIIKKVQIDFNAEFEEDKKSRLNLT